jgi:hypothetical protein
MRRTVGTAARTSFHDGNAVAAFAHPYELGEVS